MKKHDSYDTRLCLQQLQFYCDRRLDNSHFQEQDREYRRRHPERQYQLDFPQDVDPDAEWAEYCDERWLP